MQKPVSVWWYLFSIRPTLHRLCCILLHWYDYLYLWWYSNEIEKWFFNLIKNLHMRAWQNKNWHNSISTMKYFFCFSFFENIKKMIKKRWNSHANTCKNKPDLVFFFFKWQYSANTSMSVFDHDLINLSS